MLKFTHILNNPKSYKNNDTYLSLKMHEKLNNLNHLKTLNYELNDSQEYYYTYEGDYKVLIYTEPIQEDSNIYEILFMNNNIKILYKITKQTFKEIQENINKYYEIKKYFEDQEKKVKEIVSKYFKPLIDELKKEVDNDHLDFEKFQECFTKMIMTEYD